LGETGTVKRLLAAATALSGICLLVGHAQPAAAEPDQFECVGAPADHPNRSYPEPRVFLESQGWWSQGRTAPGGASAHVHVGVCFPQGGTWSPDAEGQVRLDFRIRFHNATNYRVARFRGGIACCDAIEGGGAQFDDTSAETKALITAAMPHGQVYLTKVLDVDGAGSDGRKEARFTVDLRDTRNGRRFLQSAGWQSYIDRPDTVVVADYRRADTVTARGWYEAFGYINAGYADSYSAASPPTVSGIWTPKVRMEPGSGGAPVTSHRAHVDPDFHMGVAGWIVKQGAGPFKGRLSIDTTRLSNGWHKLVLIANARKISARDRAPNGTASGVQAIPFLVSN
jgi:hypothetical protein